MKTVIVVNNNLPAGLASNACAVLGISLGRLVPELVGEDCTDASGQIHKGITNRVVPVLGASTEQIKEISQKLEALDKIESVGFNTTAQRSRTYDEYREQLSKMKNSQIDYSGICLYGDKKSIDSLTGSLPLYK